jgi:RimJ/RimL family protein N-acetyltransferase
MLVREPSLEMLVRTLTPEDAVSFIALRLRGLQEQPQAFASSYEEEAPVPLAEIEQRLQPRPGAVVFGAFDGHTLVAVVGLVREAHIKLAHKAFVWGMYVAPEHRREGIGAALLRCALAHAASAFGVRQVNLGVNTKNTAALSLYRSLGFEPFGVEREFLCIDGEYHDECQMVCRVSGPA